MSQPFVRSDSWLLFTLGSFGEVGASIPDILTRGDHFNHSVFNPEELRGRLARFLECGYATESGGTFVISGVARDFCYSLNGKKQEDVWKESYRFLSVDPIIADDLTAVDAVSDCPALSDEALSAAYAAWREQSGGLLAQALAYVEQEQS